MNNHPLNEEYLTQCDQNIFEIAQKAVNMAVTVIRFAPSRKEERQEALEIIKTYADWQRMQDLPHYVKKNLLIEQYGQEKVKAMEEEGLICAACANNISAEQRQKYPYWRDPLRFVCLRCHQDLNT
jgi:predicted TIM-barrel fold metal-dependent hydrolase